MGNEPPTIGTSTHLLPSSDTLHCSLATLASHEVVLAQWDFSHHGGSYGVEDANAFVAAVATAIEGGAPLVSVMRSGGTRLPEGMRALVGIPRSVLALADLKAAGLPHLAIAEHPTTGGVWVSIGATADVRIAMAGALIGFSGPRVVEAMTGRALPDGASTAEAAYDAGLVDVIATPDTVAGVLGAALDALAPDAAEPVPAPDEATEVLPPDLDGAAAVETSRSAQRPTGDELLSTLLDSPVSLSGGDPTVSAAIGRIAGRRAVAVALCAGRSQLPTPRGFALLERAAGLADSLDLALVVLVDTPGADPHTEPLGLVPAIATSLTAVLGCRAPTVSLVHGEGGSGGALAGAVTDVVGVGPYGWFAALGPEGAAAALRLEVGEASRIMRVTPRDLLADGFADAYVGAGDECRWVAATIEALRAEPVEQRLARRRTRWSSPLRTTSD